MIRLHGRMVSALGLLLAACAGTGDREEAEGGRSPRSLGPAAEFPTPFSAIRGVMALPNGKLIVSDPQENRISLVDFDRGTSRTLGRLGAGPREYRRAGGLSRGPGGGVLVFDQEMMRLLPVSAAGALTEDVVGLPAGGIPDDWNEHGPDPVAVDSLGHTYMYQDAIVGSAAIMLRYLPGQQPDTMAHLTAPLTKALRVKPNGLGDYQTVLFSPADGWAIAPDGVLAVVRAEPYRVEWIPQSGPAVLGPIIDHQRIKVSRPEKEFIASGAGGWQGKTTLTLVLVPPGGLPRGGPRAQRPPIPVDELLFAKVKPPVDLRGDRRPMIDERGWLWVPRSMPFGITRTKFDVFDRTGALVDRIELPDGSLLVGFGPGAVYAARRDVDGFEYLQRFTMAN